MLRSEKEVVVEEIAEILGKAKSIFITDFQGLNVEKMQALRQKCREASVGYQVIKNTLGRRAAEKAGCQELADYLEGPSAIAFSYDDPSAPARVIVDFAKTEEKPTIKVSIFEGEFFGPDRVKMIAELPPREVLLSKMVGGFNAPIQGLVGSLNGLLSKLVRTLDAVRNTK